jgi:hypothetical protein
MNSPKLIWITHNAEHLLCDWTRDLIEGTDEASSSDLLVTYLEEFPQMEHLTQLCACFSCPTFIPNEGWFIYHAWVNQAHYCTASIREWIRFTQEGLKSTKESSFYLTAYTINKELSFKMPILWEALTRTLK